MGCTAGCLNIRLDDEKHIELFAETFIEIMNDELYDPLEKEDVVSFFDTDGDISFTLDAEPIFSYGHGYENVIDFLKAFIKKAPDVELSGDFYSDWDNCCDICCLQFEYKNNKLSIMRLFSEVFGVECDECGAEVEMSDVEIYFDNERCPVCPECGARILEENFEGDEEGYFVNVDDLILSDGEWILPEGFEDTTEGDYYLTGVAPDEITNAWKYEDVLAAMGVLPELPTGEASWSGLPRVHAAAEEGDEKAIEILAALDALEKGHAEEMIMKEDNDDSDKDCKCCDCDGCEEEETADKETEEEEICVEIQHTGENVQESVKTEECKEKSPEVSEDTELMNESCGKKKSKWWIVLLVLVLLAAGAAAVHFLGLFDLTSLINEFGF